MAFSSQQRPLQSKTLTNLLRKTLTPSFAGFCRHRPVHFKQRQHDSRILDKRKLSGARTFSSVTRCRSSINSMSFAISFHYVRCVFQVATESLADNNKKLKKKKDKTLHENDKKLQEKDKELKENKQYYALREEQYRTKILKLQNERYSQSNFQKLDTEIQKLLKKEVEWARTFEGLKQLKTSAQEQDTLQVELRLVEHARDTAKDRQFSLSAEKDREQLAAILKYDEEVADHATTKSFMIEASNALSTQISRTTNKEQQLLGVTQELTAAQDINEPSKNRAAHDGNLGADVSLLGLDKFTPVDAEFVKRLYPVGAVDAVTSSSEVNRLRLRVSAQELVDLRASISLKNTAILSLLKALQRLDDKCMKKWLDLGGEGVDDELQCWCFNDDGEVLGWIRQMREIRKRAAGRTGKRVSYEDESPAMTSSGGVNGE
ncbi:uncharacterized protein RAG0_13744 [Rhynchosporium agropyri]|uniref:Uncharacterized protein n=1 Tax=Rhynchosporium agropyri TaxID=914238 RepID=A0A1E1LDX8_9HELO|nr:uncharacterized protein RAG0_13744 [Rhynchosporium agropyri]